MRKILRAVWLTVCVIVIVFYLLSCFSFCISPAGFSFISLFAIAFPYLFVTATACCLTLLFIKKKAALLLIVIVFAAGLKNLGNTIALHRQVWSMQKKDSTLRIMTWNVEEFVSVERTNSLSVIAAKMVTAINAYKPDVLCLQEYKNYENTMRLPMRKVFDSLGFKYSFCSMDSFKVLKKDPYIFVYSGAAVFSRRPLADSARINIHNTSANENAVYTDVYFNNRRIRIFTAHLSSFRLYTDTANNSNESIYRLTYTRKRNTEYRIRANEVQHIKQVAIIRNAINQSPYPVIYCGDLNATPATYSYNKLKGNLQDAFLQKGSGIGATFYKLLHTLRIDVCLVDNSLTVEQCTVPQLYLSDHFPVVTDVSWK